MSTSDLLEFFWLLLGGMHQPAPRVDSIGRSVVRKQASKPGMIFLLNEGLKNLRILKKS